MMVRLFVHNASDLVKLVEQNLNTLSQQTVCFAPDKQSLLNQFELSLYRFATNGFIVKHLDKLKKTTTPLGYLRGLFSCLKVDFICSKKLDEALGHSPKESFTAKSTGKQEHHNTDFSTGLNEWKELLAAIESELTACDKESPHQLSSLPPTLKKLINENNNRSLEQSIHALTLGVKLGEKVSAPCNNKPLLMVIGASGVGKSTAINYLNGCTMTRLGTRGQKVGVAANSAISPISEIGHGSDSETLIPNIAKSSESSLTFCDSPGFFDTRGSEINLINAINISETFNKASSVKLLLLVSYSDLRVNRGKAITTLTKQLNKLFDTPDKLKLHTDSILIGVTKAPKFEDEFILSEQEIRQYLFADESKLPIALKERTFVIDPLGLRGLSNENREAWLKRIDDDTLPISKPREVFKLILDSNDELFLLTLSQSIASTIDSLLQAEMFEQAREYLLILKQLKMINHPRVEQIYQHQLKAIHAAMLVMECEVKELSNKNQHATAQKKLASIKQFYQLFSSDIPSLDKRSHSLNDYVVTKKVDALFFSAKGLLERLVNIYHLAGEKQVLLAISYTENQTLDSLKLSPSMQLAMLNERIKLFKNIPGINRCSIDCLAALDQLNSALESSQDNYKYPLFATYNQFVEKMFGDVQRFENHQMNQLWLNIECKVEDVKHLDVPLKGVTELLTVLKPVNCHSTFVELQEVLEKLQCAAATPMALIKLNRLVVSFVQMTQSNHIAQVADKINVALIDGLLKLKCHAAIVYEIKRPEDKATKIARLKLAKEIEHTGRRLDKMAKVNQIALEAVEAIRRVKDEDLKPKRHLKETALYLKKVKRQEIDFQIQAIKSVYGSMGQIREVQNDKHKTYISKKHEESKQEHQRRLEIKKEIIAQKKIDIERKKQRLQERMDAMRREHQLQRQEKIRSLRQQKLDQITSRNQQKKAHHASMVAKKQSLIDQKNALLRKKSVNASRKHIQVRRQPNQRTNFSARRISCYKRIQQQKHAFSMLSRQLSFKTFPRGNVIGFSNCGVDLVNLEQEVLNHLKRNRASAQRINAQIKRLEKAVGLKNKLAQTIYKLAAAVARYNNRSQSDPDGQMMGAVANEISHIDDNLDINDVDGGDVDTPEFNETDEAEIREDFEAQEAQLDREIANAEIDVNEPFTLEDEPTLESIEVNESEIDIPDIEEQLPEMDEVDFGESELELELEALKEDELFQESLEQANPEEEEVDQNNPIEPSEWENELDIENDAISQDESIPEQENELNELDEAMQELNDIDQDLNDSENIDDDLQSINSDDEDASPQGNEFEDNEITDEQDVIQEFNDDFDAAELEDLDDDFSQFEESNKDWDHEPVNEAEQQTPVAEEPFSEHAPAHQDAENLVDEADNAPPADAVNNEPQALPNEPVEQPDSLQPGHDGEPNFPAPEEPFSEPAPANQDAENFIDEADNAPPADAVNNEPQALPDEPVEQPDSLKPGNDGEPNPPEPEEPFSEPSPASQDAENLIDVADNAPPADAMNHEPQELPDEPVEQPDSLNPGNDGDQNLPEPDELFSEPAPAEQEAENSFDEADNAPSADVVNPQELSDEPVEQPDALKPGNEGEQNPPAPEEPFSEPPPADQNSESKQQHQNEPGFKETVKEYLNDRVDDLKEGFVDGVKNLAANALNIDERAQENLEKLSQFGDEGLDELAHNTYDNAQEMANDKPIEPVEENQENAIDKAGEEVEELVQSKNDWEPTIGDVAEKAVEAMDEGVEELTGQSKVVTNAVRSVSEVSHFFSRDKNSSVEPADEALEESESSYLGL